MATLTTKAADSMVQPTHTHHSPPPSHCSVESAARPEHSPPPAPPPELPAAPSRGGRWLCGLHSNPRGKSRAPPISIICLFVHSCIASSYDRWFKICVMLFMVDNVDLSCGLRKGGGSRDLEVQYVLATGTVGT